MGSINEPSVYPLLPNCLIGQVFIHPVTRSILGVGFRSVYLSASVYISVSVIYILVLSVILQSYLSLTSICLCLSIYIFYLSLISHLHLPVHHLNSSLQSVYLSFNIISLQSVYLSILFVCVCHSVIQYYLSMSVNLHICFCHIYFIPLYLSTD